MEAEQPLLDSPGASHILCHFHATEGTIDQESVAVMESIAKRFTSECGLNF